MKKIKKEIREIPAPEVAPDGYYVIFEKEIRTKNGDPAFNRYSFIKKLRFIKKQKSFDAFLDQELTQELTKENIMVGRIVWVCNIVIHTICNTSLLRPSTIKFQVYLEYEEPKDDELDAEYPGPDANMIKRYCRGKVIRFYPDKNAEAIKEEVETEPKDEIIQKRITEERNREKEKSFWVDELLLPQNIHR